MKLIPLLITALAMTSCVRPSMTTDNDAMVDSLYARMSMDERVAQLQSRYMDDLFDSTGHLDTAQCQRLIPNGMGHFSQYASQTPTDANVLRDRVAQLQQWLIHHTPNGIPALFHEEVLTGINTFGATIYPQQIGQACSFNPELAELKTRQTSTQLRRMGGLLALSPMVDVCRNPSFNRLEESYGEDAFLSAVMGAAFVRGLQQGDLRRGVAACSKHYLGYGGGGNTGEKEMMEEILLPHEVMIRREGCKVVMTGYHQVHDVNCVCNAEIMQDILQGYLGFDGMLVSDYTSIDQIYSLPGALERAAAAINAGNDVDFPTGSNYALLPEAIDKGLVKPEVLERAVKSVLRHKMRCGMMDANAYLYATDSIHLDTPEERQTAYEIATQSIVLLQNDGTLPLQPTTRVLLTGPNANSMWAMCGDYTYPAMSYFWKKTDIGSENPHIVSLFEGMLDRATVGGTLQYSRGCDWTREIETLYSQVGDERAWEYQILHRKVSHPEAADPEEALRMAKDADVIVAAMGENVMLCGENRDRTSLRLPGEQEAYVERLLATGKPVVLVLFGGRAQIISSIAPRCAAIIQAWYPGEEGGHAVADILHGIVNPSGKLSVSYPAEPLDEMVCYNYSANSDPRIAWPFGYGLSYTTFGYDNLSLPATVRTSDTTITLSLDVTNTGRVAGDEIVQVYLSPTDATQHLRPIQLQAFQRVSLAPSETKRVTLNLDTAQFGYYTHTADRCWTVDPGNYLIRVGTSSRNILLEQTITLEGKSIAKPIRERYYSLGGEQ